MATSKDILTCAAREIGCRERAGKRTKYGEWYGLQGEPWCMEFVQWVYHECDAELPFKTASCGTLLRWYRKNQPECVTNKPVPGCIVIFDFKGTAYDTDHTGLFVKLEGDYITTIDGNTGGNDSNGGYVQQRMRELRYARPVYIIPRELREEKEEGEEAVKRFQTLDEIREQASYAAPTVEKLLKKDILHGKESGLDLSEDMLRMLVINDRAGIYGA